MTDISRLAPVTPAPNRTVTAVLMPTNFDQLVRFSEMAAQSDLVPKDYRGKPANVMLAVQMGSELGLAPMQALQSIAVINGRPGVWGDGLIGLCRQSPLCEDIVETIEGEGDDKTATCIAKRRGSTPVTSTFSMGDAKRAGLAGKPGPWTQYPERMLKNRARGFALRDAFPDVLRGFKTIEELQDIPADRFTGPTITNPPQHEQPAPRREPASTVPDMDAPAPDRALAWVEARIREIETATFASDLHAMAQDGRTFNRISELMEKRPELADRYNAAMKYAKETLTEVEGGE